PSLSYSATTLTEGAEDDGSIATTITITVSNGAFRAASGPLNRPGDYALGGTALPTGLSMRVAFTSETTAELTLLGAAEANLPSDDVSGVLVTFAGDAFAGGTAPGNGTQSVSLGVEFIESVVTLFATGVSNGSLGGRSGADQRCSDAKPATLDATEVHALISVSAADEIRDLPSTQTTLPQDLRIVGPTGLTVADNWADLVDGDIDQSLGAAGVVSGVAIRWWSGSDLLGQVATNGNGRESTCSGWTSAVFDASQNTTGRNASLEAADGGWITSGLDRACSERYPVVCIAW
ncbi:MAG: hypothetical protein AAGA56_08910, partial [Myxococcota bacterium]